ncbi:DNA polymerase epsilon catalytic subunit A (DNA polymerase II subunit A) [Durusdinium trenchii]|uniref:DNA polymerase epsilon catalytic subunit n=1 Tax=Durusdinium trenchii TaxID=1381693 RepID=A0ABP0SSD6_9DINO
MVLLNDSLQLAHKCILNSFYGYVMRKGARWHSMKMAGIVTYTGANLIREAREFCEQVGLPLELDTDGIWCLLPKSFPDTFKIKMKGGKEIKMPYPNCVLNFRVHQKYTNHQYQDWDKETNSWKTSSQNSILFEIDGPYKAMILPASTEEDKMLKKRYAVYDFDGSLAELKGFEVKRRGELRLIQVFQTEVFPEFLKGESKEEVWKIVGAMANRWLDVIESRGSTMTNDEVIHFFSENKTMSKSVEAVGSYKCVQATTVRRLAEFLGVPSMLQAEGISAHMLIANKPVGASCTERAIPVKIFFAEEAVKKVWLRQWLQDSSLTDFDMRSIIDWDYYKERLCAVFQKLISIPAAYQKIANPCPRVKVPEWLRKRVAEQNDHFKQRSLNAWLRTKCQPEEASENHKRKMDDMEDLAGLPEPKNFGEGPKKWLEVQRLRWGGQNNKGHWQSSLFDSTSTWSSVPAEVLFGTWHILAIEPSSVARSSLDVKVGDTVLAEIPVDYLDDLDLHHPEEATEVLKGTILGFVAGMVRLMLDSGEEQLVKRSAVKPVQDGGLFTMWLASGPGLAVYRCEVVAKRHVILALESEMDPEQAMREVRPNDLRKGLRVRGHVGDGVVTSASKELGLCSVHWHSGGDEAVFCKDLKMQNGNATRVVRDAPRNLRHSCLVEMQMTESDFQQQHNQGDFSEDGWPRVSSVYEAEQPLLFDLMCRLGPVVRLSTPQLPDQRRFSVRKVQAEKPDSKSQKALFLSCCRRRDARLGTCPCEAQVQEAAPPESESEDAFGSHTWCDGSVSAASAASESDDDNSKQASSLTFSNPSNPTTNSVRQLSTLMPEIV